MKKRNPIIDPSASLDPPIPAATQPPQSNPILRSEIDHLLARIVGRDYWFAYDADLDVAHVWLSTDQEDAVAYPIDDQTEILINDRSGQVIGCTINDFRDLYLRALPSWQLRLHEVGLHRELQRDVPMERIEYVDDVLPFGRSNRRIARVITTHAAYLPLAASAVAS